MRTIRTKVYKFSELSETAQKKVIEKLSDINVDYDWWESTYEDVENIGLQINSFDLDRQEIKGEFNSSASEVAANIFRDHGESCETYKTAINFMNEWQPSFSKYIETEDGDDELIDMESDFLKSLLEDYRIILQHEFEYQTSKEAIISTIEANEYEFTADGRMI